MNYLSNTCLAAIVSGLVSFVAAQQPASGVGPRVGDYASLHDAVDLVATADGLQAIAMDYHAEFAAGGVEYTPHLGAAAPHDLPLHWSVSEVRRGVAVLHRSQPVVPQRHGQSVHYARGPVLETYDVSARGLKQSFVFDQPIGGDGDLVVRCDWRSELRPQACADGTLDFQWPEVGGVHIGEVVGIDAAGQRTMGSLRLDGSVLELVLPDAFVDAAVFPLVLDPFVGTQILIGSGGFEGDVAVDPNSGNYLVAYQVSASAVTTLIYLQPVSYSGVVMGGLSMLGASGTTARHPRVAFVAMSQRFLVTWQHSASPFGPFDISCAAVDVAGGSPSGPVPVAATAANEFDPAIGGDVSMSDDEAIVVWCTDSALLAAQVNVPPTGVPTVTATSVLRAAPAIRHPALNEACGVSARFLVVWEEGSPATIQGSYFTRNLVALGMPSQLSSSPFDNTKPAVDGDNGSFLVAWERAEAANSLNRDIVAIAVVGNASGITVSVPETVVAGVAGVDDTAPEVAFLGLRYALTHAQKVGLIQDEVWLVLVNPDCSTCSRNLQLPGAASQRKGAPRIAGAWVGSYIFDVAMISYGAANNVPPFTSLLVGQRVEAQSNGPIVHDMGGACALGGTNTTAGGPFVLGSSNFAFRVTGADPNALLFLSLGFPTGGIVCGPCALTNPIAFEFKVNSNGAGTSPFPIPCDGAFGGIDFEWQWVSFNTAFNPCPNAPGLAASTRLRATLGL